MLTIGASHRTASSSLLADFGRAAEAFLDRALGGDVPVNELAVLSTCARVEVYATAEEGLLDDVVSAVGSEIFGATPAKGGPAYRLCGLDAVRHVCRVASGLDSFVVGEHEISGQVARAFRGVVRVGDGAQVLPGVAAAAKRASRRVRSETGIGRYPASVSSVAVDIVRARLGDLGSRSALVVGAGEAGLLVARALRRSGIGELTVANRSESGARRVAEGVGGRVATLDALPPLLARADVVVTATGAEHVVIDVETVVDALGQRTSGRKPLLVLDLALPGDVDPRVARVQGVELLALDDVRERVHRHQSLRRSEVAAAEQLVDEVVDDFAKRRRAPEAEAVIGELRRSVEAMRHAEVERWLSGRDPASVPSREEVDLLTRSIVNKLLHEPMRRMRAEPLKHAPSGQMLRAARELVTNTLRHRLPAG